MAAKTGKPAAANALIGQSGGPTVVINQSLVGAALAWQFAFYNFCRVHGSLRVTPSMESRITDHIWTIEEVLANAPR
jgi:hypothetical protein